MPDEAKIYDMRMEIDLRQTSTAIRYDILEDGTSVLKQYGPDAGSFVLAKGGKVGITLTIYYFNEFRIEGDPVANVTLVSLPGSDPRQSTLSPFDADSAGIVVRDWSYAPPTTAPNIPHTSQLVLTSAPLDVVHHHGQWQLSCYLSIRATSTDPAVTITRAFGFDPTVIVGGDGELS